MRTIHIPGTDLNVSSICLGTGGMGSSLNRNDSFALLDTFAEQGGNFLDSAKVYADWLPIERSASERTIGRWMKARRNRDKIVVSTKGAHPDLRTMHIPRMSREEIDADVQASLEHLQVDTIDLYWLHRDDPSRPTGEIIESLNEHVKAGRIRYLGCSNWVAGRIQAAQAYATLHGLQSFVADQMMWSLAAIDADKVPDKTLVTMDPILKAYHTNTGLAAIPYSSQAGGLLQKMAAGRLKKPAPMYPADENTLLLQRVRQVSGDTGLSITQVSLGYLRSQPFPCVPIVGCHTQEQLRDSLTDADVTLTPDQVRFLEGT